MSLFTLGTMRAIGSADQMAAVLDAAVACGIRHVETAPAYGPAETFLAAALHRLQQRDPATREALVLTSKLLPGLTLQQGQEQLRALLTRLQIRQLDNLAVHGLNTEAHLHWTLQGEGRELLAWAKGEGLVGQVGFSSHGSTTLIGEALASGRFGFCSLHLHLFDQERLPLARSALAAGLGVLAISPADKGGRLYDPPPDLLADCAPFHPLELAYRFLLDQGISTLTLGAAQPEDLTWAQALSAAPQCEEGCRRSSRRESTSPVAQVSAAGPAGAGEGRRPPDACPPAQLPASALDPAAPATVVPPGSAMPRATAVVTSDPEGTQAVGSQVSAAGAADAGDGPRPPALCPPTQLPASALDPAAPATAVPPGSATAGTTLDPANDPRARREAAAAWLSPDHHAALERLQAAGRLRLGAERCGQCRACLPCPNQVPIPALLRLRNLAVGHGMVAFASERYSLIGRAGHWWEQRDASACERCGDCLPRCPLALPIPDLLADTHRRLAAPPRRRLWG